MKQILKYRNWMMVVLMLLLMGPHYALAQSDFGNQWNAEVALGIQFSQMYGDLREGNRQYASDQGTIFGQSASYSSRWKPSYCIMGSATRWLASPIGLTGGLAVKSLALEEEMTIAYDPAYLGIANKVETVSNRFVYLSPSLGLTGRWKGLQVNAALAANVFLTGRTIWQNTLALSDGSSATEVKEVKMDTQDQPIFADESASGGYVDYTYLAPKNHGANALWFSANFSGSYALWTDKPSPFIVFSWQMPLQEAVRSRNPNYSLRNGLEAPIQDDLNQGLLLKSLCLGLGYRF